MRQFKISRRHFLGTAAASATVEAFGPPARVRAAVQAAGIFPGDLRIKEVKVYVLKSNEKIASVVTHNGIEGNYTLANRYPHPNWSNLGWLDYAKTLLVGRSILEFAEFTNQYRSNVGQLSYASAINNCAWDILGKALNLPVYRLLGAYHDRVRAYASSQHLSTVDAFVADLQAAKNAGFTAYKIHPPWPAVDAVDSHLDIEVAKAVRKNAGDDFPLLFDRVGGYTRDEAMKVGRVLDQLNYISYEDPIPTNDIEGLAQLAQALDLPITIGEFLSSPYDFSEYIRRGACDVVRFIVDNIGGITGGMKVARLAECFGMECQPHNSGHGAGSRRPFSL